MHGTYILCIQRRGHLAAHKSCNSDSGLPKGKYPWLFLITIIIIIYYYHNRQKIGRIWSSLFFFFILSGFLRAEIFFCEILDFLFAIFPFIYYPFCYRVPFLLFFRPFFLGWTILRTLSRKEGDTPFFSLSAPPFLYSRHFSCGIFVSLDFCLVFISFYFMAISSGNTGAASIHM